MAWAVERINSKDLVLISIFRAPLCRRPLPGVARRCGRGWRWASNAHGTVPEAEGQGVAEGVRGPEVASESGSRFSFTIDN